MPIAKKTWTIIGGIRCNFIMSFIFLGGIMLEKDFQAKVVKEIKNMFPDSFVLKCDGSNTPQGFPDILIINGNKWAVLEFKKSERERYSVNGQRPNQEYYISRLGKMSFAKFIYPENKEDVLDELQQALRA